MTRAATATAATMPSHPITHAAPATGRALLLEILGWSRPHESECELRFARSYLDVIPGMTQDAFGNRILRISNSNALWSCHIDTVARHGGPQAIAFDGTSGIASLADGKPKMSLGADDGVGVWIMLEMIRMQRPGLYVFHRGEEVGCLGSRWIVKNTPELFDGIGFAMAFDRAGYTDVITHQASGRTCSDAFAQSFAAQLNACYEFGFRPDDSGVYTDTNEYAQLVPECSNLSVGYFGQHSHKETLDVYHAEAVLDAMLDLDASLLTIERDPADVEPWELYGSSRYQGGNINKRLAQPDSEAQEMAAICEEFPSIAASILLGLGITPAELWSACLGFGSDEAEKAQDADSDRYDHRFDYDRWVEDAA